MAPADAPAQVEAVEPAEVVKYLDGIAAVRRLDGGKLELSLSEADAASGWDLATRSTRGRSVSAWPYERVWRDNIGYIGAGVRSFQYLGDRGEYVLFRESHSFYNEPEIRELLLVRPYVGLPPAAGSQSRSAR
jgi:hypothetical protein